MDDNKLNRINELAAKQKAEGLNEAEIAEQKTLREEYLADFRGRMKEQLLNVKVVDPEGNDITPQKLKDAKKERENNND